MLSQDMKAKEELFLRLYGFYNLVVYPRLEHIRGFTRLGRILRYLGEIGEEKVDEKDSEDIWASKWNNLIILDSCRYDIYKDIRGNKAVDKRVSQGSSTGEFISKNFSRELNDDVVYISAVRNHIDDRRFKHLTGKDIQEVFSEVYNPSNFDFNERYGVPTPKGVYKATMKAKEDHPNKRKIIHFLQPHYPFINYDFDSTSIDIAEVERKTKPKSVGKKKINQVFHLGYLGEVDDEELLEGYIHNLREALNFVDKLSESLEGKTLLTSDHGEMLEGDPHYGHFKHSRLKGLREVPKEYI